MVYGLYALSPESGLVSLRRLELIIRDVIPASGDQDHAISLVRRRVARLATQRRPSHPASNVRDGRDTSPPEGSGCADMIMDLRKTEEEYFSRRHLTRFPIRRTGDLPVVSNLQQFQHREIRYCRKEIVYNQRGINSPAPQERS